MLHARADYNERDLDSFIPKDEPVFLLRAKDKYAPELLLRWAAKLRLDGGQVEMARLVEDHAMKMLAWPGRKTPDM